MARQLQDIHVDTRIHRELHSSTQLHSQLIISRAKGLCRVEEASLSIILQSNLLVIQYPRTITSIDNLQANKIKIKISSKL